MNAGTTIPDLPPNPRGGGFRHHAGLSWLLLSRRMMGMVGWFTVWTAFAQLQVLPDPEPQRLFGGSFGTFAIRLQNVGDLGTDAELSFQFMAIGAASAAPQEPQPWRRIEVLPGQTVIEYATLDLPAVSAETRWLVTWLAGTNQPIGVTELLVYPTNVLAEIRSLADAKSLGVVDPGDHLKPWLRQAGVGFTELAAANLASFRGRLAILTSDAAGTNVAPDLGSRFEELARAGVASLWFQPPRPPQQALTPSFYPVPVGTNAVVLAHAEMVMNLANDPRAQMNLVGLCRFALRPEPFLLPYVRVNAPTSRPAAESEE